jgi:hypothetical protein
VVCQHTEDIVIFPDGTRVLASGWLQRTAGARAPDFGLYLDPAWTPSWPSAMLDWPDFGVPADAAAAEREIRGALARARAGQRVEVACVGGHGRTGTVLACMAILSGVSADEAVEWVRQAYCRRAVQEPSQQYWIEHRFAVGVAGPESHPGSSTRSGTPGDDLGFV